MNAAQEMHNKSLDVERRLDELFRETGVRLLWQAAFFLRHYRHQAGPPLPDLDVKFNADGKMEWKNPQDLRNYFDVLQTENQKLYTTIVSDIKREGEER